MLHAGSCRVCRSQSQQVGRAERAASMEHPGHAGCLVPRGKPGSLVSLGLRLSSMMVVRTGSTASTTPCKQGKCAIQSVGARHAFVLSLKRTACTARRDSRNSERPACAHSPVPALASTTVELPASSWMRSPTTNGRPLYLQAAAVAVAAAATGRWDDHLRAPRSRVCPSAVGTKAAAQLCCAPGPSLPLEALTAPGPPQHWQPGFEWPGPPPGQCLPRWPSVGRY